MLCGLGVKAGMACLQVTLCVAIPECFGKCYKYLKALCWCPGLLSFSLGPRLLDCRQINTSYGALTTYKPCPHFAKIVCVCAYVRRLYLQRRSVPGHLRRPELSPVSLWSLLARRRCTLRRLGVHSDRLFHPARTLHHLTSPSAHFGWHSSVVPVQLLWVTSCWLLMQYNTIQKLLSVR